MWKERGINQQRRLTAGFNGVLIAATITVNGQEYQLKLDSVGYQFLNTGEKFLKLNLVN